MIKKLLWEEVKFRKEAVREVVECLKKKIGAD
jgi:hypothetical protein